MTHQAAVKRILQDLIRRDDLGNKTCADCPNPNPQWASVSFAVFICLQCAGAHRSYGVHVSFVRSVSMDTWSDDQIRRMQLGGNKPLHDFLAAYEPADQGGYDPSMSAHDKYHCWAATQYREKLDYTLQDKPWSPSPPPPTSTTSPPGSRPSSAQSLRKSRTGAGATRGPSAMSRSASSSSPPSPATSPNPGSNSPNAAALDRKTANENYFASLGSTNALRPADLPPSQGGRYAGFGSTPPPTSSAGGGGGDFLTSRNAPTLTDLQDDPIRALSKGWSLFAGAVAGAGKAFSENVLQPGVEKVQDPAFQASVRGYVEDAQKSLGQAGASANAWSRDTLGVDVGAAMGGVGRGGVGGSSRAGYGAVPGYAGQEETSALYRDNEDDEDDFFAEFAGEGNRKNETPISSAAGAAASSAKVEAKPAGKANDGWDDDWKEF